MIKHVVIVNCTYTTMQKTPFAIGKWTQQHGDYHERVNVVWNTKNSCLVYSNDNNKMTINIHDTVLTRKMTEILNDGKLGENN